MASLGLNKLMAPNHYLNLGWPSFMSPYGITRPQWVNPFLTNLHPALSKLMVPVHMIKSNQNRQLRNLHTGRRTTFLHRLRSHRQFCEMRSNTSSTIDQSHKSHNASDKCCTMHNSVTEMCTHFCYKKWCIVGNATGALWDVCIGSIPWLAKDCGNSSTSEMELP